MVDTKFDNFQLCRQISDNSNSIVIMVITPPTRNIAIIKL